MKTILAIIVIFFTSFSHEYQEKWVCHAELKSDTRDWCYVVVIKAETKEEAELKFKKYMERKQRQDGGMEEKRAYAIAKLKDAIMIEP